MLHIYKFYITVHTIYNTLIFLSLTDGISKSANVLYKIFYACMEFYTIIW